MKPRIKLASARIAGGHEMVLERHDRDFTIRIAGQELMTSRQHESELELARLGCAALAGRATPSVLVGGLGLGYTLRAALDLLPATARVVVGELMEAVVQWNREYLAELNGRPLADPRVELQVGDVVELISRSVGRFDAILLDIDNGPSAMTTAGNRRLYGADGIHACRRALRDRGCLAVWSVEANKRFEQILVDCGLKVRRYRVPAYKGSKSLSRFVWVASADATILPPGGGEPHPAWQPQRRDDPRRTRGARPGPRRRTAT
jgi:spermidine synthase